MVRPLAIAAAFVVLLGGAALVSAPTLVRYFAESKVDAALKRIRVQTTSVVNRGDVSVDLSSWSVTVKDLEISGAPDASRVRIGAMTIGRPSTNGSLLNADRVTLEQVVVRSAGETITVPRVEITGYSGPERGLTSTPGVGRNARTQADLIGQVSLKTARAPVVLFSGDATGVRRTIRNARISDVVNGVVGAAAVEELFIEAPYLSPEKSLNTSAGSISATAVVYEGVSLPVLWRFYAGDGVGDREPFLKSASIGRVEALLTRRPGGVLKASAEALRIEGVELRPLAYPATSFDPIVAKIRLGEAVTPQEVRQQLRFAIDAAHAVSVDRIAVGAAQAEMSGQDAEPWSAALKSAEIAGYQEGRIEIVAADGLSYNGSTGRALSLARGEISKLDATGLMAYSDRVGRDEILLTTAPTVEEIVRIAPRVARLDARAFEAAGAKGGSLKIAAARVDVDAPPDAVPQRFAFRLDGLDAKPAEDTALRRLLSPAKLDELVGSAAFTLTLDPNDRSLKLDGLDYQVERLGEIKGKGELTTFDPTLVLSTGAELFDKISAVELGAFQFTATDDGAVAVMIERAAAAAGQPKDEYRETIAREAQETIARLFGPPAAKSAESAAQFIRDPRAIEVLVAPKSVDTPLLELVRAFDLGPVGIAQVIDLEILYRR